MHNTEHEVCAHHLVDNSTVLLFSARPMPSRLMPNRLIIRSNCWRAIYNCICTICRSSHATHLIPLLPSNSPQQPQPPHIPSPTYPLPRHIKGRFCQTNFFSAPSGSTLKAVPLPPRPGYETIAKIGATFAIRMWRRAFLVSTTGVWRPFQARCRHCAIQYRENCFFVLSSTDKYTISISVAHSNGSQQTVTQQQIVLSAPEHHLLPRAISKLLRVQNEREGFACVLRERSFET